MRTPYITSLPLILVALLAGSKTQAQSFAPFVIPGTVNPASSLIRNTQPIETTSPRLVVEGDHFACAGERVRIWGNNTTFASSFPEKTQAPRIARRLAAAGINCIRFHHMDTSSYPNGIWNSTDGKTIDPTALDRLDYFISQLAANGVYANINLHVGRAHSEYLGLPDPGTDFDKVVDIFTPALLDAQKLFAQQLLGHVNPYRGVRLADDPAVAIVEITNEDSFFMWDGDQRLRALPPYYADILDSQYNTWLKTRYASDAELAAAWSVGTEPAGPNQILNPTLETPGPGGLQNWIMETHSPATATASPFTPPPYDGGRIEISAVDGTIWHLQFKQVGLTIEAGRTYALSFVAAADTTHAVALAVMMDGSPYTNLGLSTGVSFTPDWTTHTLTFTATSSSTNARLAFQIGQSTGRIYLANADLHTAGAEPPGPNILLNPTLQAPDVDGGIADWVMEEHTPAAATAIPYTLTTHHGGQIVIPTIDGTSWHLQFKQTGIHIVAGQFYTLSFSSASESERTMDIGVLNEGSPWAGLGFSSSVDLTPRWTTHTFGFTATGSDTNARLSFTVGESSTTVYLADVNLHTGGQSGLLPSESLDDNSVAVFVDLESLPRTRDRLRFLAETEKTYFDDMRNYVKTTLGSQALITGTIVFGPLGLYGQSDMDFIDAHSYWQHPSFPGNPWDPNNWTIGQSALTDNPTIQWGGLFVLGCNRLAGKPFTVTEYNHPAPNDYQAECVPLVSSFAAAQNWDGVFLFDYGNPTGSVDPQAFGGYFDCFVNADKWGFTPAGAAILRDSAIGTLPTSPSVHLATTTDTLGDLVEHARLRGNDMYRAVVAQSGYDWQAPLAAQLSVVLEAGSRPTQSAQSAASTTMNWTLSGGRGFYSTVGEGGWAFTGHAADFAAGTGGLLAVASPAFAGVTLTALDSPVFSTANRILVTAGGRCENTDMVFSPDRSTVGTNWGHAPVQIEAVEGELNLPNGYWRCRALNPDGTVKTPVLVVTPSEGAPSFHLSPSYGTMWYLLERGTPSAAVDFELYE